MSSQSTNRMRTPAEADALEARFGLRLTARLQAGSEDVGHDISERLRVARQQALERARQSRRAQLAAARPEVSVTLELAGSGLGRTGLHAPDEESPWWMRLGILVPLTMLVLGLVGIEQWHAHEQILSAAEIDAALLGDDLPPAAYADPGFAEFVLDASAFTPAPPPVTEVELPPQSAPSAQ